MALVRTYHYKHVTIRIMDDAYRDASPEEIKRRIQDLLDVTREVDRRIQMRKAAATGTENGMEQIT